MKPPREYPERPMVGVAVAVFRDARILLIRRARPPAEGQWSLPGGAQRVGETIEHAARRELAEETGLTAGLLHLAAIADAIHRDASGRVLFHYSIIDLCCATATGTAVAGGDAAALRWVPIEALPGMALAGETARVIEAARAVLASGGQGAPLPAFSLGS